MLKRYYFILSNLKFRTFAQVELKRQTKTQTQFNSSNKKICLILELYQIELLELFETQPCDHVTCKINLSSDLIEFRNIVIKQYLTDLDKIKKDNQSKHQNVDSFIEFSHFTNLDDHQTGRRIASTRDHPRIESGRIG